MNTSEGGFLNSSQPPFVPCRAPPAPMATLTVDLKTFLWVPVWPPDVSLRQAALIAGLALLLMTFLTPFANFGVLHTLIVPGDAHTTAQNIAAGQGLFRIAIAFFF